MKNKEEFIDEKWDDETIKNWQEKMNEPIKFRILSPDQIKRISNNKPSK